MQEIEDGLHGYARDAANNVSDGGDSSHKPDPKSGRGSEQKSEVAWGSHATKYGIYTTADGKRVAWGMNIITEFDTAPDLKAHCPARFAPASTQHAWCYNPGRCWAQGGDKAHERHPDYPKEACKAASIGSLATPIDWDDFTVTIKAPSGGRNAHGKREREDEGQPQAGKGAGKGNGKGKGAGKGRGKGGGRNGGKGRGRGFPRQPH